MDCKLTSPLLFFSVRFWTVLCMWRDLSRLACCILTSLTCVVPTDYGEGVVSLVWYLPTMGEGVVSLLWYLPTMERDWSHLCGTYQLWGEDWSHLCDACRLWGGSVVRHHFLSMLWKVYHACTFWAVLLCAVHVCWDTRLRRKLTFGALKCTRIVHGPINHTSSAATVSYSRSLVSCCLSSLDVELIHVNICWNNNKRKGAGKNEGKKEKTLRPTSQHISLRTERITVTSKANTTDSLFQ